MGKWSEMDPWKFYKNISEQLFFRTFLTSKHCLFKVNNRNTRKKVGIFKVSNKNTRMTSIFHMFF